MSINDSTDRRNPSAWRSHRLKMKRSVRAVSIAWLENSLGTSRAGGCRFQEEIASPEIQRVTFPRCTSARSYWARLLTRYAVLYLGWILDLIPGAWPIDHIRREFLASCSS